MERELFVDAAFPGYVFKAVVDGIERRHFKKITIACQTSILIQNEQRIGQQFDDIFRLGLLAVAADPPIPVRILFELIVSQRRHVGITDTRETGEQEHVAVVILALVAQAGSHHTPKFILGQETTLRIRCRILVEGKRVAGHPAVVEGDLDHVFKAFEIAADCGGFQTQNGFQIDMVLLDERLFKFGQRHIAHAVFFTHERTQMVDGFAVAFPCAVIAVDADTFTKIGGELLERFEKHAVFLAETEVGIFDLLGRDERIPVADSLIVLADLGTDIIQMTVDPVGLDAPAFGSTAADFPQLFRNGKFRTELRDAAIDRNPAHDWNRRLFLLFVPFEVEQNLECAAHKLCCFKGCKYNLGRV